MVSVKLEGVTKRFGKVVAVNDVTLQIEHGEFFTFLGPSGCGKTTTLRVIAGLETADEGRIFFDDMDVTEFPPHKRNTGMVFQNYALWPHMTVFDNIAYGLKLKKLPKDEVRRKVKEVLELIKLSGMEERYPTQLSGGQQQRVALARALVVEPKVLLLDEPLSNLDLALREELRDELRRIQRTTSVTFIYVTHDQDEALELADELLVLHSGRVVEWGDPRRVFEEPTTYEAAAVLGHNLIPLHALGEVGLKPHKAVFKGGVTYGVIPQHVIKIKECLTPNCSVIRKSLRRYYGIVTLKCGKVVLKAATPLDMLRNYVEGMKICVDVG